MAYSNLAYDWDGGREERIEEEVKLKRTKLRAEHKRELAKTRVAVVCYVLMIILSAVFMIGKNVTDYEGKLLINQKEKELSELQSYTSQKLFELEKNIDLVSVEEAATSRLGMQRPDKKQMVYVNIKQDDVCDLSANKVEGMAARAREAASDLKQNVLGIFSLK